MAPEVVRLAQKFGRFADQWKPKIVAELNDSYVKVVKLQGEFVWHHHDDTDDFFLVIDGRLEVRLRDRTVVLGPGELDRKSVV